MLQVTEGVALPAPAGWRVLQRRANELLVALDDPEEQVTLRAELLPLVPLPDDGDFSAYLDPDGDGGQGGDWQPGRQHGLRISRDYRGRGPHLVLVDCLPVELSGLCRIEVAWPLSGGLEEAPERVVALAADSLRRVGAVLDRARLTPTWPLPLLAPLPTCERLLAGRVALDLPVAWTPEEHDTADAPSWQFADDSGSEPFYFWCKVQRLALDQGAPDLDAIVRAAHPGARRVPLGQRPGVMPVLQQVAEGDRLVAWRQAARDDGRDMLLELGLRARRHGGALTLLTFSLHYLAERCREPATYSVAEQLWQAVVTARFLG